MLTFALGFLCGAATLFAWACIHSVPVEPVDDHTDQGADSDGFIARPDLVECVRLSLENDDRLRAARFQSSYHYKGRDTP